MGHQFVESGDGMVNDAAEHVAEAGEWVNVHEFTRGDEGAQNGCGFFSVVVTT
jgi:hypothetical protein